MEKQITTTIKIISDYKLLENKKKGCTKKRKVYLSKKIEAILRPFESSLHV
jgi:hypothetical protein